MPGSIADSEQWEICWAKPIGPIKQAERQRCINEAISQSKNQKEIKAKKVIKKQLLKNQIEGDNFEIKEELFDSQNLIFLKNFVSNILQAECCFECFQNYGSHGFFHKVHN